MTTEEFNKAQEIRKSIKEIERLKQSMERNKFAVIQADSKIFRRDLKEFIDRTLERYRKMFDEA